MQEVLGHPESQVRQLSVLRQVYSRGPRLEGQDRPNRARTHGWVVSLQRDEGLRVVFAAGTEPKRAPLLQQSHERSVPSLDRGGCGDRRAHGTTRIRGGRSCRWLPPRLRGNPQDHHVGHDLRARVARACRAVLSSLSRIVRKKTLPWYRPRTVIMGAHIKRERKSPWVS